MFCAFRTESSPPPLTSAPPIPLGGTSKTLKFPKNPKIFEKSKKGRKIGKNWGGSKKITKIKEKKKCRFFGKKK
jgi:hypothetical protein